MDIEKETYYMICFDSSQRAIQVESALAAEFEDIRLVPIPPEIRVSCGLGIKVSTELLPRLKERISDDQVFLVIREGSKRSVKPWIKE
jgi:hypothetical protein